MNETETAIVAVEPVRPLVSAERAAEDWALFESLKSKLLKAEDYAEIKGAHYIRKSGFRKIAVAFNLSDRIVEQVRTDREDRSFMWRIVIEVEAPNHRVCMGVGICDSAERNFNHIEHDVYATAHTRAKNRAISDMVAGGVVSAEEIDAKPETVVAQSGTAPAPAKPAKPKKAVFGNASVFKEGEIPQ